eukprot:5812080-Alexandrium_andersonii.AAC.1
MLVPAPGNAPTTLMHWSKTTRPSEVPQSSDPNSKSRRDTEAPCGGRAPDAKDQAITAHCTCQEGGINRHEEPTQHR